MKYVTAILPSVGVLGLFVVAMRAIFQADRRERLAQARMELQDDERRRHAAAGESGPKRPSGPAAG